MFFFETGIILLLAFIGAFLAFKFGQAVMLGYIFIGVLIGPYCFNLIGIEHLKEGSFIRILSEIGLVMLLFFIGLEFSLLKLRKTKMPVVILATIDVGVNMFVGFLIATFFNWHFIDALFFAAVFAMSSVAVIVKILEDLKVEWRVEVEILVSLMIVEDFIAVVLLTIMSGFSTGIELSALHVAQLAIGIVVLFAFFAILAFIFIPTVLHRLEKAAPRPEFLALLVLGLLFLTVALAEFFGIAGIIGAFLAGMAFAETALAQKIKTNFTAFKDIFVAVFFLSFGMQINPQVFPQMFDILAVAVLFAVVNGLWLLSAVAYLIGLPRKAAVTIGSGSLGRCEESIIFASIGTNLRARATGEYILAEPTRLKLSPFAGLFSLITSVLTSVFFKNRYRIADWFERILPKSIKTPAGLVVRTLKPVVMAPPLKFESKFSKKRFRYAIAMLFSIVIFVFIPFEKIIPALSGEIYGIPCSTIFWIFVAVVSCVLLLKIRLRLMKRLEPTAKRLDITDFTVLKTQAQPKILKFVVNCITIFFGVAIFIIVMLHINLWLSLLLFIGFLVGFPGALYQFYKKCSSPPKKKPKEKAPPKTHRVVVIDKKLRVTKVKEIKE